MDSLESNIRALKGPILVTGASGFVGANLFKKLYGIRDDVYAIVHGDKGWRLREVPDEQTIEVDLNDYVLTRHLVDSSAPQTVFHCAAYGAYSFEDDATLIYQTNFQSAVNLVDRLSSRSFTAFVSAGSSSEYGTNCTAPTEDSLCEPNSPYAVSKVAIANYLHYMGKQQSFPAVNLRLYSVYGPLEDTSRLLPTLLREASAGRLPPLVDPRTSRDFVHVDDVCEAFVLSATRIHPGLYGESINIGTGAKTTIGDLVELTREIFHIEAEPQFGSMEGRSWDVPDWYSDPAKASREIGWSARTTLEDGLVSMSKWVDSLSDRQMAAATKKGSMGRRRSVSAVIACYKDAQAIPVMHKRLSATFNQLDVDYEIIFVNDGSPDDSADVIREISKGDHHVVGITHSRNYGSQMAFRSGMELSTMDGVVLLDGDLQDPPELISEFYANWEAGYDVVYGRRIKREMPWHRGLEYKLFYRLFARYSYVNIPLDAGDFSLMDRRVVRWLLNCPERDLFMRGLRAYVGFKQTGVDYVRPERMFGRSTNSFTKNIDWAKKAIFSFSNAPLTMLTNAGIISLAVSLVAAVVVFLLRVFVPHLAPQGVTTVLLVTLIFGSFNLFAIGIVGEYVSKIMTEVKERPRLIRASLIRNGEHTELLPDGKAMKVSATEDRR
ncbi:MAG: NAD-dependent epimerase/dehydratase family protein [Mycobacterium sp.]|uniref:NAD-dependent epimerase/dehydratase family protein n=1 Tax=Mycobacterium sp. TaxID=1785 RepID=UPI001EC26B7A|nr:NAD-dependent epimerase/dehydratase family protein [Mycobacterium sp.]MBW0017772.1 NAD-dependent epimerase/dehydratase family protein [Mycobacterium sp.]